MSDVLELLCRADPVWIEASDLVAIFDSLEIVPPLLFGDELQQAEGVQHIEDALCVVTSRSNEAVTIDRLQRELAALENDLEREDHSLISPMSDRASRSKLLLGLHDVFVVLRSSAARSDPASSVFPALRVVAPVPRLLVDPRVDVSAMHAATRTSLFAFFWGAGERRALEQWRF